MSEKNSLDRFYFLQLKYIFQFFALILSACSWVDASALGARAPIYVKPDVKPGSVAPSYCDDANTHGTGSADQPYDNLYNVIATKAQCGDTIILQAGTYRLTRTHSFFVTDTPQNRLKNCSNKESNVGYDGEVTLMPINSKFSSCTAKSPLIIMNAAGADAVLDGSDARLDISGNWKQCTSSGCCGSAVSLANPSQVYCTQNFQAMANTAQIWVAGKRLQWWANSSTSNSTIDVINSNNIADHLNRFETAPSEDYAGKFFMLHQGVNKDGNNGMIIARLSDGSSPNGKQVRMSCQGGNCAYNLITVSNGAKNVAIMKNGGTGANGKIGSFILQHAYYPVLMTTDPKSTFAAPQNISIMGLEIRNAGGRDYGHCVRTFNANYVTLDGIKCSDSAAEGIGFYGGGPGSERFGFGINIAGNVVKNSTVYNTGFAFQDGGNSGLGSLGQNIILKNCTSCSVLNNKVSKSFRAGIQVSTSTACTSSNQVCRSNGVIVSGNIVSDNCRFRNGQITAYPQPSNMGGDYCGAIQAFVDKDPDVSNPPPHEIKTLQIRNNTLSRQYSWSQTTENPAGVHLDSYGVNAALSGNVYNDGLNLVTQGSAISSGK